MTDVIRWLGRIGVASLLAAPPIHAQTPAPQPPAPPPSQAVAAQPVGLALTRGSWLSDRLPLRVGDLLTIVVDEQTAASEKVRNVVSNNRSLQAQIGANVDSAIRLGPSKSFSTGLNNSSNDQGEAGRQGNLTAVLTVRVTGIDPNGVATIEGGKSVTVDGRLQEVRLKGAVRPEDVTPQNLVSSNRIADAVISYKGKKMGPRTGIIGKILSILWP